MQIGTIEPSTNLDLDLDPTLNTTAQMEKKAFEEHDLNLFGLQHPASFIVALLCSAVLFPLLVFRWHRFSSVPSMQSLLVFVPLFFCFAHYTASEAVGPMSFSFGSCLSILFLSSSLLLWFVVLRERRGEHQEHSSYNTTTIFSLSSIIPFTIALQSLAVFLLWINDVADVSSSPPSSLCARTGTFCSMLFSFFRLTSVLFSHQDFYALYDQRLFCVLVVVSQLSAWALVLSLTPSSDAASSSSQSSSAASSSSSASNASFDSSSSATTDNTDSKGNFTPRYLLSHLFRFFLLFLLALLASQLGVLLRRRAASEEALFLSSFFSFGGLAATAWRAVGETLSAAAAGEAFANALLVACEERVEGPGAGKRTDEEAASDSSLSDEDEIIFTASTPATAGENARAGQDGAPPQETSGGEDDEMTHREGVESGDGSRGNEEQEEDSSSDEEDEREIDNLFLFGHGFAAAPSPLCALDEEDFCGPTNPRARNVAAEDDRGNESRLDEEAAMLGLFGHSFRSLQE